ncbi:ATP-binding protein [Streptomyces sp. NPDC047108]|uniref:ATP-binding protein n=1 Tax=Streptomyces sp. NPDC047108 TaxID=3155025 RepID=UPI0033FA0A61
MSMERATPPPAARPPALRYTSWLVPPALCAGTLVTAATGPVEAHTSVLVGGIAATTVACAGLLIRLQRRLHRAEDGQRAAVSQADEHQRRQSEAEQARIESVRSTLSAQMQEQLHQARLQVDRERALVARLAEEWLPEALRQVRDEGAAIDDVLSSVLASPDLPAEFGAEHRALLREMLLRFEDEYNRSTTAEQAVVSIGSRMQVHTSKIRGLLHRMQQEHGGQPAVARGLMALDKEVGPADCLAASIVVLGGADRPSRQFQEPRRLLSVVRGGQGRIKDFERVEVAQLPDLGVDGALVDHLTLILAQLLDNATRYSPPSEPVIVSGKEVPNGVGIKIQDAGKGLNEEKKREAQQALDGVAAGPAIGGLAEEAQLGLRVVGTLARKYDIRVTFDDSPWLGTSVVVVVPLKYFSPLASSTVPEAPTIPAVPPQRSEPPAMGVAERAVTEPVTDRATTAGGLPKRSRRPRSESPADDGATAAPAAGAVSPDDAFAVPSEQSFSGMAAFASGSRPAPGSDTDDLVDEPESDTP